MKFEDAVGAIQEYVNSKHGLTMCEWRDMLEALLEELQSRKEM